MWRWVALVMLAACAAPPPAHPRSVVTVREWRHVVMNVSSWACSNQCPQLECALQCPTAQLRGGTCGPDDDKPDLHCRNFSQSRTYERDGRCADGEVAGVERVSCTDKKAEEPPTSDNSTGKQVLAALLLLPVIVFVYVVFGDAKPIR